MKKQDKIMTNEIATQNIKTEETVNNKSYVVHDIIPTKQASISEIRVENNENGYLDLVSLSNNSNKKVNETVSSVKQLSLFNEKNTQIETQKGENFKSQPKITQNENTSNETNLMETKNKANDT